MTPYNTSNTKMPGFLTIILVIGLFPLIYFTMTADISDNAKNMMSLILGYYLQYTGNCVNYFVGTTFSSGAKDNMIYNSTPANKEGNK